MAFENGPYLQAAVFCQDVIEDKSGALSLIRLIDTLTHAPEMTDPPKEMPPINWNWKLVVTMKAGKLRGRHEVKMVPQLPSGETRPPLVMQAYFEADEQGQNLIADMRFTFALEGVYWFAVYFDDDLLTKLPFRVKYMPVRITAGPAE